MSYLSTTLGPEESLLRIQAGLTDAVAALPVELRPTDATLPLPSNARISFEALTLGMAGLDRETDIVEISPHLAKLFGLDPQDQLRFKVGNDAISLAIPMLQDRDNTCGITLVAGVFALTPHICTQLIE
jgi:hypothetical protein